MPQPAQATMPSWEEQAEELLSHDLTAREFSQKLFSQGGLFSQACRSREDREKLLSHPLYRRAQSRFSDLLEEEGRRFEANVAAGQTRPARMTIQVPRSLHAALKREAAQEGVSLSELVRLKLGFPYSRLTRQLIEQPVGAK